MRHYICTGGCRGESVTPGTCQAKDCTKYGQPLLACDCEDAKHDKTEGRQADEHVVSTS